MAHDVEKELTPAERIMLLGDTWAAVRVGKQPISDFVTLAQGLQNETSRPVLSQALDQIEYIGTYLTSEEDRPQYEAWVRQLLAPTMQRLGFEPKSGEGDDDRQLRSRVLRVAGETGRDPQVLAWARKWTEQALQSSSTLDYTIAGTALELAVQDGDAALYDRLVEKQKQSKTPEEYYVYLGALGSFSDPKLIERTLQRALSSDIRSQDALGVVSGIMGQSAGRDVAWAFVKSHWSEIDKIGGGVTTEEVVGATSSFCSSDLHDQVEQFFKEHKVPTAERGLQQSLERINYCVDLKSRQGPRLAQWLNEHENRAGQ